MSSSKQEKNQDMKDINSSDELTAGISVCDSEGRAVAPAPLSANASDRGSTRHQMTRTGKAAATSTGAVGVSDDDSNNNVNGGSGNNAPPSFLPTNQSSGMGQNDGKCKAPLPPDPRPSIHSILHDPETNDWMDQRKDCTTKNSPTNTSSTAAIGHGVNCPSVVTESEAALARKLVATTKISLPHHQLLEEEDPHSFLVGGSLHGSQTGGKRGGRSVLHKTQVTSYALESGVSMESLDQLRSPNNRTSITQLQRTSSLPGAIPIPGPGYHSGNDDDDHEHGRDGYYSGAHNILATPSEASSEFGMESPQEEEACNNGGVSSEAFEPEKPVEATLVNPNSSEVFTAQPMMTTMMDLEAPNPIHGGEGSNLSALDGRSHNGNNIGWKDLLNNPRIRCWMAGMCGFIMLLVVGMSVGLAASNSSINNERNINDNLAPPEEEMMTSNSSSSAASAASPTTTTTTTTAKEYPAFSDLLLPPTAQTIVQDPSSPAGRANAWTWEDPHLDDYSIERQLMRFGLVAMYYSLNGDNWHRNDGWLDYDLHECEWYSSQPGGSCLLNVSEGNGNGNEYEWYATNLSSNALSGLLPIEIYHLTDFHSIIDLHNNSLRGTGPPLRNGGKMSYLDVSNNYLDGPVTMEAAWSNENIWYLNVSNNLISGVVPTFYIESIPNLRVADFSYNRFYGDFPDTFSTNNSLKVLNVAGNQLEGEIPPSLIDLLDQLEVLDISGNENLAGSISDWKIDLPKINNESMNFTLVHLDVSGTDLTGSVPASLCDLQAMGQLSFQANCAEVECCSED